MPLPNAVGEPPYASCLPASTCRSVRGLTLRLADVELTAASEGRQAVAIALPLLLEKGKQAQGGWCSCVARGLPAG